MSAPGWFFAGFGSCALLMAVVGVVVTLLLRRNAKGFR